MKKSCSVLLGFLISLSLYGQSGFPFSIELDSFSINGLDGVQSFAKAQSDGKWLILTGRTNGVHPPQPPFAFETKDENKLIYVVDPIQKKVWQSDLVSLPMSIQEQMKSTNAEFYQNGDTLYIVGGYGYSSTLQLHVTYPFVTAINVTGLVTAIMDEQEDIAPFFKQGRSPYMQVTGAQLGKIGETYYLVGGQKFTGLYNPNNGVSFSQAYTKSIRKFKLGLQADTVAIYDIEEITDENSFRRRDYNLVPQVFPDGEFGYMLSSGVFQKNLNLPYLSPTDIRANNYQHRSGFEQYLSHYHSAKFGAYDSDTKKMYSVFLGGMAQYYYEDNTLIQNDSVPFVKTISVIIRDSLDSLYEVGLVDEMPRLTGSNAEIFYNKSLPFIHDHIVDLSSINEDTILVGYIFGGIVSQERNPFALSHNLASIASNQIYKLKIIRTIVGTHSLIHKKDKFDFTILANPIVGRVLNVKLLKKIHGVIHVDILSQDGKILLSQKQPIDNQSIIHVFLPKEIPSGVYFIQLAQKNEFAKAKTFIVH